MVEAVALVAVLLLVVGVVGSVVPLLPGPLLSLAGIYLYWWHTGFVRPGALWLVALTLVGLFAVAVDFAASAIAARAGGADRLTVIAALVVGIVLALVTGPLGLLLGVAGTVFGVEYYQSGDARGGARAAVYATVGVLGSALVQAVLTGSMLVAFLLVAYEPTAV